MNNKNENCDSIGRYVSEIYRAGNIFFSKAYTKYDIGAGQYLFLRILYKLKVDPTQEELSDILNIDKATTARAVKRLEETGYIVREKKSEDKRVNIIRLTEKALSIKEEFFRIHKLWENKITEQLNDEEKQLTLNLLKKIVTSDSLRRS